MNNFWLRCRILCKNKFNYHRALQLGKSLVVTRMTDLGYFDAQGKFVPVENKDEEHQEITPYG